MSATATVILWYFLAYREATTYQVGGAIAQVGPFYDKTACQFARDNALSGQLWVEGYHTTQCFPDRPLVEEKK